MLLQKDTTDGQGNSFRRLRNTEDILIPPPIPLSHPLRKGEKKFNPNKLNIQMILQLTGGVDERLSIHSVKLMNTGPHSQITNHGFSRQLGDGNFFNY